MNTFKKKTHQYPEPHNNSSNPTRARKFQKPHNPKRPNHPPEHSPHTKPSSWTIKWRYCRGEWSMRAGEPSTWFTSRSRIPSTRRFLARSTHKSKWSQTQLSVQFDASIMSMVKYWYCTKWTVEIWWFFNVWSRQKGRGRVGCLFVCFWWVL